MQAAQQSHPPRSSQACRHCRSLKARCLPSSEPSTCQRCLGLKRECSWPDPRPRPKRPRNSTSRISNVEEKLDGLVAMLGSAGRESSSPKPPRAFPRHSPPPAPPSAPPPPPAPLPHPVIHEVPSIENGMPDPTAETHQTARMLVTEDEMLDEFRSSLTFFPFIYVPPTVTPAVLRARRPHLFRAVQLVTCSTTRSLQVMLEEQFRRAIAETMYMAQKNLDVLQSLEVYLAYYHIHFKPQSQQIYQLLALAVSMVIDLGYHSQKRRARIDISDSRSHDPADPAEERETQRALLGCYYLSSAFAGALARPTLFKHTAYMATCAERLQQDAETAADTTLPHIIELCRLSEHMNDLLASADSACSSRTQLKIDMLKTNIQEWMQRINPNECPIGIELAHHFVVMDLHSTCLNSDLSREAVMPPSDKTAFVDNMFSCLDAGKRYLDVVLECPLDQYRIFSFIEWMRLPVVLLNMAKLSFENDYFVTAGWDPRTARSHVRLDLYLESLCYRMQSLTTFDPPTQPHADFFLSLKMILERTRQWYGRSTKAVPLAAGPAVGNGSVRPDDSPLEHIKDPHETPRSNHSAHTTMSPPIAQQPLPPPIPRTAPPDERTVYPSHEFDLAASGPSLIPDFTTVDDPANFLSNDFWESIMLGDFDTSLGI